METLNVSKIQALQREMVQEREWDRFHTPKNLAMASAVEAAELAEIFQWLTEEESYKITQDPKKYESVKDELADVMFYLLRMADLLKIDVEKAILSKMEKSKAKYPIEKAKGNIKKYDEL